MVDPEALVGDVVEMLDTRSDEVSDAALQRMLSAAIRMYARRAEACAEEGGECPAPVSPALVNATEAITIVSELIHALDLNLFDLMLWHNKRR